MDTTEFIKRAKEKHGDKYDYSKTEARKISMLEIEIQKENKQHKYAPLTYFPGIEECFSKINDKWLYEFVFNDEPH